jgi:hypothetical protein
VNGTIAVVMAVLVAVLAAIGLLTGEESGSGSESAAGPSIASIAHRVERVRELRFKRLPSVRQVTSAEARADALRELDREVPARAVAREAELLKLLGLIPADASLRRLLAKAFGNEVAGYYDPRTGKLALVDDSGGILREISLAHELTHALEDQHFDIDTAPGTGFNRDRSIADTAVREGTATLVMVDYVIAKRLGRTIEVPESLLDRLLSALDQAAVPASSGLPRYLRESLVFPYPTGARLVDRVERSGGWKAVNRLFGPDAPVSSEQVMHPAKLRSREPPIRVRVGSPSDWARGDFGEFDTEQLLRAANGRARSRRAAAGWGGGGFAIARLGGGRYRLVIRWVYDSDKEADEFEPALRRSAARLRGETRVTRSGRAVTLTLQSR